MTITESPNPVEEAQRDMPLPKNRAVRRAHGQRGTAYLPVAKHRRTGSRAETGPQRAQRRAAVHGLTVGAPVRADVGAPGRNRPSMSNEAWDAAHDRWNRRPGDATPLERIDRMARYLLQRDVTTHVRHGSSWQPTPRQRRRLGKKERAAQMRRYAADPAAYAEALTEQAATFARVVDEPPTVRQDDPEFVPKVVTALLDPANTVKPERERSAMHRGFRVVDRRGEHR